MRRCFCRLEAARADVTRAIAPPGRLILGLTPLAWADPVAGALAAVRAESARLRTRVRVADRDRIVEAVATGEIDLGLVDGFTAPNDPLRLPEPGAGGPRALGVTESPAVVAVPADAPTGPPLVGRPRRPGRRVLDRRTRGGALRPAAGRRLARRPALRRRRRGGAGRPGRRRPRPGGAARRRWSRRYPGLAGVPIGAPRLVHRVELLRLPAAVADEPAERLAALLGAPAALIGDPCRTARQPRAEGDQRRRWALHRGLHPPYGKGILAQRFQQGDVGRVALVLDARGLHDHRDAGGGRVGQQLGERGRRRSGPGRSSRAGRGWSRTRPWSRWRGSAAAGRGRPWRPARPASRSCRPGWPGRGRPPRRGRCRSRRPATGARSTAAR